MPQPAIGIAQQLIEARRKELLDLARLGETQPLKQAGKRRRAEQHG